MNPATAESFIPASPEIGVHRWKPFTRETRLRNARDLGTVREQGRVTVGRFVVVKAVPAPDGLPKAAIVVSRRFSLKAVDRNRARRLLREAVRLLASGVGGWWLVLLPRQSIKGRKLAPVAVEVESIFREMGLWTPPPPAAAAPVPPEAGT